MATNLPTQLLLKGVQAIEKFTGAVDQDPSDWLQAVDELFEAGKIDKSDRRRLLLTFLGDDVKNWYRSEELSAEYDIFKQQFIKAFTSSGYRLQIYSKIINRRQRLDEAVQSYYYDILSLCKKLNSEMTDNEKILHLLRGLKPSLLQQVMLHDPSTCQELLEYAKRAEVVAEITQSTPPVSSPVTSPDEITETTAALRRLSTNNYSAGPSSRYQRESGNNYRPNLSRTYDNHNRTRQPRQPRSSEVVCYNCRGIGHRSYQCPSSLN